jgi:hypothetical protein
MTTREELKALAETVQKLTGPCHATDCAIEHIVCPRWTGEGAPKPYTASLDAAMSLADGGRVVEILLNAVNANGHEHGWVEALPRYVTAAALLARAEQMGEGA